MLVYTYISNMATPPTRYTCMQGCTDLWFYCIYSACFSVKSSWVIVWLFAFFLYVLQSSLLYIKDVGIN